MLTISPQQRKAIQKLADQYHIPLVVLFGSIAKGKGGVMSDIDLGFEAEFPDMKIYSDMLSQLQQQEYIDTKPLRILEQHLLQKRVASFSKNSISLCSGV